MTDQTLAQKIALAALAVGGKLKADKRNKDQGYDYISADKILAEAGQALAEQGVAVIPTIRATTMNLIDRGSGKTRWDAQLEMLMIVTDGMTTLEIPWAGWGSDYLVPDKAAYKAITSGDKYFRMKLLSIGEGNEDSEHEPAEEPQQPQRQQVQRTAPAPANGNGNGKAQQPAAQPEPEFEPAFEPAEAAAPTVSLETAMALTSSDGKTYGSLTSDELADKSAGIVMALRRKDITQERRDELKMRIDAIGVILKARKENQPA